MALNSGTVTAGSDATALQYNNLRKDVLQRAGELATAAGDGNTITLSVDAQVTAYITGQRFSFKTNAANTGAATLNVNTIGAVAIKKNATTALSAGDLASGKIYEVEHDGTNFQLLTGSGILEAGSASDANLLHTHRKNIGTSTLTVATGTNTQNVAHGLPYTPTWCKISTVMDGSDYATFSGSWSDGEKRDSTYATAFQGCTSSASSPGNTEGISSTKIIELYFMRGGANNYSITATATFDGTNIALALTNSYGSNATIYLKWECGV